jgi:hypothetical protein
MPSMSKRTQLAIGGLAVIIAGVGLFFLGRSGVISPSSSTANAGDGWVVSSVGNAIDGEVYAASKTFTFAEQKSRLDMAVTCTIKTKDIKVSIESYGSAVENGHMIADPFVTSTWNTGERPAGRIKSGDADPASLGALFTLAGYSNVISWTGLRVMAGDDFGNDLATENRQALVPGGEAALRQVRETIGAGNYLHAHLPLVIEVQNSGGTEQITIPKDDAAINQVIEKCTAHDLPSYASIWSGPTPAPETEEEPFVRPVAP